MPLHIPAVVPHPVIRSHAYLGIQRHTFFESIDYLLTYGNGNSSVTQNGLALYSTASYKTAGVLEYSYYGRYITEPTWAEKRRIKAAFYPKGYPIEDDISLLRVKIGTGYIRYLTRMHIGFVTDGETLHGTVADGTTQKTVNLGNIFQPLTPITLEAIFYPGEKTEFYVDEEYKDSIVENLPSGTAYAEYLWNLEAYRPAGVGGQGYNVYFNELKMLQEE